MTAQRNHYEVLGVSPTANTDQIKTKYRELARKFHPDVVKDKTLGQKVFTQINQAYRVLADPERRAQYDAGLRANVASAVPRNAEASVGNGSMAAMNGATPPSGSFNGNGRPVSAQSSASALSPQQTQAVARLIGDADFALLNSDPSTALEHCQNALRLDPKNARAYGLLGEALEHLGRHTEAAAAYRQSLEAAPSAMIQAKLNRLLNGGSAPSSMPGGAARTERTLTGGREGASRSESVETASSAGIFGRFLGRKK
jgi:curved DNA-binding protein CbpA